MGNRLELSQKQSLNQKMIQGLTILQMNSVELEKYIEEQALENPTIEITEKDADPAKTDRQIDLERKINWLETTDYQNSVYYHDEDDMNTEANWYDIKESGESLADYLRAQIIQEDFSLKERRVLDHMIDSIDSRGYFDDDMEETADYLQVSVQDIENMLSVIQSLEPAGVGARNLQECFMIQLRRSDIDERDKRIIEILLKDYLELIAKNHFGVIASKLNISHKEVLLYCDIIKSFNPKPGNYFNDRSHFHYISPDVVVVKFQDRFEVLVTEYQYPSFKINSYYSDLMVRAEDQEVKRYLQGKIQQTQQLQDNIRYRASTLSRIAHLLVDWQVEFFNKGPGYKVPMKLEDLADQLDLHVSTISRGLNNKYLQCAWGIYPLNYFLTSSVTSNNYGEAVTKEQIIIKIKDLIEKEDKAHPFSDQKISDQLKKAGIDISRRTVTKYRQIAGIPDKSGRKIHS